MSYTHEELAAEVTRLGRGRLAVEMDGPSIRIVRTYDLSEAADGNAEVHTPIGMVAPEVLLADLERTRQ